MNQDQITIVEQYVNHDISVVPTGQDKLPVVATWGQWQKQPMEMSEVEGHFSKSHGVGVIGGAVSDGLEWIDFDAHGKAIDVIFNHFKEDVGVATILSRYDIYMERTPRGGYHMAYKFDCDGRRPGNMVMARWEDKTSMIETRGEGGYCICYPTDKYEPICGDLNDLPRITDVERDYLIETAKKFNEYKKEAQLTKDGKPQSENFDNTDPVSWFNWNKADYAKQLLIEEGWKKVKFNKEEKLEYWLRPEKEDDGKTHSATWGRNHNALYVFTSSAAPFGTRCYYTPFQILVLLRFDGNYRGAMEWIVSKYFEDDVPYIRVGINYFKKIVKKDRYGIDRTEIKPWNKDEIKLDHGNPMLKRIPRFDDFTIQPNNFNYQPVINNCYNQYREFPHQPVAGEWKWTEILIRHIFGDQYDLGMRYLQILYLHPDHMMPILVLVSKERQTGKTTFINWLGMIFGDNMVFINPEDLNSGFNSIYANSNIIAIEETMFEKSITVEKLKDLATKKFITVNPKFVTQYRLPFFGKIILTSNNEDKFAKIDQEEIRFFVRKVPTPTTARHQIEEDIIKEIPAFLHHLTTLPPVNFKVDRTGFTPKELENDSLKTVKAESRSETCKEIVAFIEDLFMNEMAHDQFFYADVKSIKDRYYKNNNQIGQEWIRRVLKVELNMKPTTEPIYFQPFNDGALKTARPFKFERETFLTDKLPPREGEFPPMDDKDIPF